MKRNIDLTNNMDFDDGSLDFSRIHMLMSSNSPLEGYLNISIVDVSYCLSDFIEIQQCGGIIQGRHSTRKLKEALEDDENHCMRCGRIRRYPWEDFSSTICPQCDMAIQEINNIYDDLQDVDAVTREIL